MRCRDILHQRRGRPRIRSLVIARHPPCSSHSFAFNAHRRRFTEQTCATIRVVSRSIELAPAAPHLRRQQPRTRTVRRGCRGTQDEALLRLHSDYTAITIRNHIVIAFHAHRCSVRHVAIAELLLLLLLLLLCDCNWIRFDRTAWVWWRVGGDLCADAVARDLLSSARAVVTAVWPDSDAATLGAQAFGRWV